MRYSEILNEDRNINQSMESDEIREKFYDTYPVRKEVKSVIRGHDIIQDLGLEKTHISRNLAPRYPLMAYMPDDMVGMLEFEDNMVLGVDSEKTFKRIKQHIGNLTKAGGKK